jgi:D-alanyl-D-alanine carboxypeptidase/D-alanyl-D-alanine-endopeptidase (penicillin-binding protein 4)
VIRPSSLARAVPLGAFSALLSALATGAPALAVDRSLGADVPKPAATGAPWTDAEIASLDANADVALAGSAAVRGAHVGIYAIDARDGRVLYQRNPDDAFQPASTFKLLVGSAALERLGPAFRFHTEVLANGPVAGGTLQGPLVLRGGGDPFLNAADLDAAASAVAKAGITRTGPLSIDDTRYETPGYLPGWNWDDFPYYYAPVVSALTFEENVVHLTVAPGAKAGDAASVTAAPVGTLGQLAGCREPTAAVTILAAQAQTGAADAKDTIDLQRDRSGCIRVVGTIPMGAKPDTVDAAVPSPALYAYDAFVAALKRHGVAVADSHDAVPAGWPFEHRVELSPLASPSVATTLWSHDSEPLRDTLADLWLPSDNLVAELLLRELGTTTPYGTPGTTAHGIAVEQSWLKGLGIDTTAALAIEDGSGLSTYDRISPRALVRILKHDWDGPYRDLVLDDLPLAGVRGTLKSSYLGTPAEKKIFAKTGSISHVSALAGYAANAKHGAVIFAFQVDDWVGETAALRELRARILARFVDG